MQARIFNQGRLAMGLLALTAAVVAAIVIGALTDAPPAPAPAQAVSSPSNRKAQPMAKIRKSSKRSVIVQSGRSAKGRSVTAKGEPGESATATGKAGSAGSGSSAKGGAGASASAEGASATSSSVKIQTTGP